MIRRLSPTHRLGLLGLVVLVVGALVADRTVVTGEVGLTETLNDLPAPVVDALRLVMQLGTHAAILLVALVVAVLADARRLRMAVIVVLAGGLASIGATLIKEAVERPRPPTAGAEVRVRDDADGFAYPSSHVSIATGTLAGAALATRRRPAPALAVGGLVGLGRMAAGVHLPLDVVGGLGLGAVAAATVVTLAER